MDLPFRPPLAPMLARLVRELPDDGYLYEPKWDGFRALVSRSGADVEIHSRHGRPMARYFPEVVEAVRAALEPVCREVVAEAGPELVRLSTLTHLATTVAGHLADPAPSALALAGLLHPTPAVGGIPRADALVAIAELESFDRGLYAGPVGWVDSRGDGDWAVALHCADLAGSRARLVAGAGIVADSDPDAEWAETEAKLGPMLGALAHG